MRAHVVLAIRKVLVHSATPGFCIRSLYWSTAFSPHLQCRISLGLRRDYPRHLAILRFKDPWWMILTFQKFLAFIFRPSQPGTDGRIVRSTCFLGDTCGPGLCPWFADLHRMADSWSCTYRNGIALGSTEWVCPSRTSMRRRPRSRWKYIMQPSATTRSPANRSAKSRLSFPIPGLGNAKTSRKNRGC